MPPRIPKMLQPRLSERFPNIRTRKSLDRAMSVWIKNERTARSAEATRKLKSALEDARKRLGELEKQLPEAQAKRQRELDKAESILKEPTRITEEPFRGNLRDYRNRARYEGRQYASDVHLLREQNIRRQMKLLKQSIESAETLLGEKKK